MGKKIFGKLNIKFITRFKIKATILNISFKLNHCRDNLYILFFFFLFRYILEVLIFFLIYILYNSAVMLTPLFNWNEPLVGLGLVFLVIELVKAKVQPKPDPTSAPFGSNRELA